MWSFQFVVFTSCRPQSKLQIDLSGCYHTQLHTSNKCCPNKSFCELWPHIPMLHELLSDDLLFQKVVWIHILGSNFHPHGLYKVLIPLAHHLDRNVGQFVVSDDSMHGGLHPVLMGTLWLICGLVVVVFHEVYD